MLSASSTPVQRMPDVMASHAAEVSATPPLLVVEDIAKSYGGAHALRGVSLSMRPGEVHGLVGANGAGKSTLIRILAGLTQPDRGRILLDGMPTAMPTPHRASELGMSFIHQELAFVPSMNVVQNITLGLPKPTRFGMIDWRAVAREVAPVAKRVGITAPLFANAKGLSIAENWLINICRALSRKARLIVMDEPTASLSAKESEKLFAIVEDLARSGVAVLYVSHRLDEVLRLCSRVTVFRDGKSVAGIDRPELTREALVQAIVGGSVEHLARTRAATASEEIVLQVSGLVRLPRVKEVSFTLRRGEVLGIGGLVGSGRTELARLIFGADRVDGGAMTLEGAPYAPRNPAAAVKAGLGLVPEERRADGLVLSKSVAFNLQISNLARIVHSPAIPFINDARRAASSRAIVRDLAIKTQSIETPVLRLSGGNQQKVVIGRWLLRAPKVLILDEPTRGVDIGARGEIHRLIRDFAAQGMAVLVISSEPDELPDLCDRVLVMAEGSVVRELQGDAVTRNAIIEASYAKSALAGGTA
jgi:ribose transport system ATP-binding protein